MKKILLLILMLCSPCLAFAEDLPPTDTKTSSPSDSTKTAETDKTIPPVIAPEAVKALLGDAEEMKAIDKKTVEAKEEIKKEIETVEVAKKEAEKVVEEKNILEKDALIKQEAASLAKLELEAAKSSAEEGGGKGSVNKIRELAVESYQLDKLAQESQDKLEIAEKKARLAQESVQNSSLTIETLNKELIALKKEKNLKQGWLPKLSVIGSIIGVGLLLMFLLNWALHRFEHAITDKNAIRETETTLRLKTLLSVFRWTGSIVVLGIILYMVLDNAGVDMAPILAGAGILGLAVGFGGQYLIRDIINGIFILVEGQYRINDVVKIGDLGGLVEAVNLRHTRLRDLEGRVIYIPNGKVETVINFTQEFAQAVLNIGVAYKENVDQVMAVLADIGTEIRKDKYFSRLILGDLEVLGVDDFADSQVTIKCRIKTLPIKQWEVAREFRRRIKNKFDELDIEIPFPHKTVYEGKPKDMSKLEEWRKQRPSQQTPVTKRDQAGETN